MGSEHLGEELGRLNGQLQGLAPALEHMEERERETVAKIATLQAQVHGLRKDFDELVRKLGVRLKDVYTRLGALETIANSHIAALAAIQKGRANVWKKIWDVSKILITIILTALATKYLGGGKP